MCYNPQSVHIFLFDPNMHVAFSPIRNPIRSSTQLISSDTSGLNPADFAARLDLNDEVCSSVT